MAGAFFVADFLLVGFLLVDFFVDESVEGRLGPLADFFVSPDFFVSADVVGPDDRADFLGVAPSAGVFVVDFFLVEGPTESSGADFDLELPAPDFLVPDFVIPDLLLPDFAMSDLLVPDFEAVDFETPDFNLPALARPDFDLPNFEMPDFVFPSDLLVAGGLPWSLLGNTALGAPITSTRRMPTCDEPRDCEIEVRAADRHCNPLFDQLPPRTIRLIPGPE